MNRIARFLLPLSAGFLIVGTSAQAKKAPVAEPVIPTTNATPTTHLDSVSYALGVAIGNDLIPTLRSLPDSLDVEWLTTSFTRALRGDSTLLSYPQAISVVQAYMAQAEQRRLDENRREGEIFLERNALQSGVVVLPSGLQYRVLTEGKGRIPQATDRVSVHYTGTLIDGTVFDSSIKRGQPTVFGVTQVIKGWTEALQLMPVGSKWQLFIPYNLAYGDRAAGKLIQPYSTLIFEVELLGIEEE